MITTAAKCFTAARQLLYVLHTQIHKCRHTCAVDVHKLQHFRCDGLVKTQQRRGIRLSRSWQGSSHVIGNRVCLETRQDPENNIHNIFWSIAGTYACMHGLYHVHRSTRYTCKMPSKGSKGIDQHALVLLKCLCMHQRPLGYTTAGPSAFHIIQARVSIRNVRETMIPRSPVPNKPHGAHLNQATRSARATSCP